MQAYQPTIRVYDADLSHISRPACSILDISIGVSDDFAFIIAQDTKLVAFCGDEQKIFLVIL